MKSVVLILIFSCLCFANNCDKTMIGNPSFVSSEEKMDSSEIEDFNAYLMSLENNGLFSGTVLIFKDEEVIMQEAYGNATETWKVENTVDTKFNLASLGKIFTAVAIIQLVEQNLISLDENIGKILPEIKNNDIKEKVTIRHLLTHRSGVADIFNQKFRKTTKSSLKTISDWDEIYLNEDLMFEPGSEFHYSNGGFILLGKVIEKVSRETYYDYIQKNIFNKALMQNSGYFEADEIVQNLATGYTYANIDNPFSTSGELRENIFLHTYKGGPAGGGYSTIMDLFNFHRTLYNGELISPEMVELITNRSSSSDEEGYGFGFQIANRNGSKVVGHTGGFSGISTIYEYYEEENIGFIALCNYDLMGMLAAERFSRMMADLPLKHVDFNINLNEDLGMTARPNGGDREGSQMSIVVNSSHLLVDGIMRFVPLTIDTFYDVVFEENILKVIREDNNQILGYEWSNPYEQFELIKISEENITSLSAVAISKEELEEYCGRYKIIEALDNQEIGDKLTVSKRTNGLFVANTVPLLNYDKDKFFDETNQNFQMDFHRDSKGEISGYTVKVGSVFIARTKKIK